MLDRQRLRALADGQNLDANNMALRVVVGEDARLDLAGRFDLGVGNFQIGGIRPLASFITTSLITSPSSPNIAAGMTAPIRCTCPSRGKPA